MLRVHSPLPARTESAITAILDCAFAVHRELGPGFKESIYETAMCLELDARGVRFEQQREIEVQYKHWTIPGQRLDLIVADEVIVEIKAVPRLKPLHQRQLVSYLRSTTLRAGLLLNFNVRYLKSGIRRVIL